MLDFPRFLLTHQGSALNLLLCTILVITLAEMRMAVDDVRGMSRSASRKLLAAVLLLGAVEIIWLLVSARSYFEETLRNLP